jgi:hypothetical protein
MRRRIPHFFLSFALLSIIAAAGPASGATPTYCAEAKALQAADRARSKLDQGDTTYPKKNVAAWDALIKAQKALEFKLSGDQKAIMTAERRQTEKIRDAVAKAKTATAQAQNEAAVRTDFTPQLTKATEAYTKLYPAIDRACGTKILRGR